MPMDIINNSAIAKNEKTSAALSSVLAAILLTLFKIIVGIATNSLGILAEAAHSGLDLVAALITLFAVHVSEKQADTQHNYGHGKVENLSALIETMLLLLTCAWIIYESVQRIFFTTSEVDPSFWAFLVMIVSIGVDFTRSRVLNRAAKKHNSQALEADALHFSTDIWSSSVVILGLAAMRIAPIFPDNKFLEKADAIAALGVAAIVVFVSIKLGVRTVQGLLDHAPTGLNEQIEKTVEAIPGVIDCHRVRVRTSGPSLFIDLHMYVDPHQSLKSAHLLTTNAAAAIRQIAPKSDVTVHAEPSPGAHL